MDGRLENLRYDGVCAIPVCALALARFPKQFIMRINIRVIEPSKDAAVDASILNFILY